MVAKRRGSRSSRGDVRKTVAAEAVVVKEPPLTAQERAVMEGRSTAKFLEGEDARKWMFGEREF